jgi:hypothetical protein
MHRRWDALVVVALALLGTSGCHSTDNIRKPPKHPDELTVPPMEDTRFSLPPQYPENKLNQDDIPRPNKGGIQGMPGGPGGMGGVGPGGMGGPPSARGGYR